MTQYVRACALADVPLDAALAVKVGGTEIAIVRHGDEVFAILDECSHAAIPLSEGDVEGCEIECWLHGSRFDLRSGKVINLPATEPVPVYPCTTDGADVLVDLTNPMTDDS
jgi:3-phenylpropionate/trans-cinnamate dioxygenase ferredoxin subunit